MTLSAAPYLPAMTGSTADHLGVTPTLDMPSIGITFGSGGGRLKSSIKLVGGFGNSAWAFWEPRPILPFRGSVG